MPVTTPGLNIMLDALGGAVTNASLHTADPSPTGANEVAGGTYARVAVTFNAAAAANLDSSNQPQFDVPGGVTITHWAIWNTAGTTVYAYGALSASETFGADGTYTLTDVDVNGS